MLAPARPPAKQSEADGSNPKSTMICHLFSDLRLLSLYSLFPISCESKLFTKIARMPRALHGDEWHPLIPSPLRLCHNSSSRPSRAKRDASRDPGRVWIYRTLTGFRISPALGGLVRNDGFGELWLSLQGGEDISWKILEAPTFGRRDSLYIL
jgi:hypothetical protein